MSKFRKVLNYILIVLGGLLLITSMYKRDITVGFLGLIVMESSLSSLSLDKSEEKIKTLEQEIEKLKGDSNDTN